MECSTYVARPTGEGVGAAADRTRRRRPAILGIGLVAVLAVWLGVVASAAAAVPAAEPSTPAAEPPAGHIAFVRDGNIWLMDTDGSDQRQISQLGGAEQPVWSPCGRQIAYLRNGKPRIITLSSLSDEPVPFKLGSKQMPWPTKAYVKSRTYWVGGIAWSPDGEFLTLGANVYRKGRNAAHSATATRLFRVRPDGSDQTAISPLRPETRRLPGPIARLSWRPDGATLLVSVRKHGAAEVAVFDPATRTYAKPFATLHLGYGVWDPHGQGILVSHQDTWGKPGRAALELIDGTTFERTVLLRTDAKVKDPSGIWASWYNQSAWIVCGVTDWDDAEGGYASKLYVLTTAGGEARVIGENARQPAWRPGGG